MKNRLLLSSVFILFLLFFSDVFAAVIIRDNFEYVVGRDDSNAGDLFRSGGGWGYVKTAQVQGANRAKGWLYTTATIDGFSGSFPGTSSSRVLALESKAGTLGQTDFYLQIGNENGPDIIPGNVWIQFWIYANNTVSEPSQFSPLHDKYIYPCTQSYPCPGTKTDWIIQLGSAGCQDPPRGDWPRYDRFICMADYTGGARRSFARDDAWRWRLGQNLSGSSTMIFANTWTLVKIHIDTSSTYGTYEAWLKPAGSSFVKVSEWIHGITPNFTWPVTNVGGKKIFRMPTTLDTYDSWQYMDDFVIATSEEDLPTYAENADPGKLDKKTCFLSQVLPSSR